jgi:hypothetical protein
MADMKKTLLASALALTLLSVPAMADGGVKVGVLNCDLSAGVGLILGGSQAASCVFQGPNGAETYEGRISEVGLDIGFTDASVMSWLVFAPGQVNRGALQGTYVGATAEATIAVGLGANVLVGGSESSIALQPVSVDGQAGLNVAAGLAKFSLRYMP